MHFLILTATLCVLSWYLLLRNVALVSLSVFTVILSFSGTVLLAVVDLGPAAHRHCRVPTYVAEQRSISFRLSLVISDTRELELCPRKLAAMQLNVQGNFFGDFICGEEVHSRWMCGGCSGRMTSLLPDKRPDFYQSSNIKICFNESCSVFQYDKRNLSLWGLYFLGDNNQFLQSPIMFKFCPLKFYSSSINKLIISPIRY